MTNDATKDYGERAVAVLGMLGEEIQSDERLLPHERIAWSTVMLMAKSNVAAFNSVHSAARRDCRREP